MVFIEHGSYSIKSVSVCVIFLNPKPYIWQQESKYFILLIIEYPTIPKRMITFLSTMEVLIISSIPQIYAFQHILGSVWVHKINDNLNIKLMCRIHQLFKFLRSPKPGGNAEEVSAMIAKRSIIRVLYDSHDLDNIISQWVDPGKYIFSEVTKAMHFLLRPWHPNMALIDLQISILPGGPLVLPFIVSKFNVDSIECMIFILTCEINPCRNTISEGSVL